ncbi:MAG: transposase [Proteobacteria bacterium]|nr:transposase [Pseudomonadota bacterium]
MSAENDKKAVAADLRLIYAAITVAEGETRLVEFETKWGTDYPSIVQSWRCNWTRVISFFEYPSRIRKHLHHSHH